MLSRFADPRACLVIALAGLALLSVSSRRALAQDAASDPIYTVSDLVVQYTPTFQIVRDRPTVESLEALQVGLARSGNVLVGPLEGGQPETIAIEQIQATHLTSAALGAIGDALVADFAARGIEAFAAVDPAQVDPATGRDLRSGRSGPLRVLLGFDGPYLDITRFNLRYNLDDTSGLPPIDEVFRNVQVTFYRTDEGYVAWRPQGQPFRLYLADLQEQVTIRLSLSAVQAVLQSVNRYLIDDGLMGVRVAPAPGQLRGTEDIRSGKEFQIEIVTGVVTQIRTLAAGSRIDPAERLDNPAHAFIREKSPIQPASVAAADGGALLRRETLDDYLHFLSRHPGRRVDAALAPSDEAYGVSLDYIVAENKPWMLYFQVSNTGTEQTDEWRQRFGVFNNQLTGNDDILSLEFVTASFTGTNAVIGSYDAKLFDMDRVRWRGYGSWSEYEASDVGRANERFEGTTWQGGGEVAWNIFQDEQLFIDVVGGLRYTDIEVTNEIVNTTGEESFLFPSVGARLLRYTAEASTDLNVSFEFNPDWLNADVIELNQLGRLFPDNDWTVLKWDAVQSFYLEPIFARDKIATGDFTLAHEMWLRFRGQYAFDNRLIPQEEQIAGGLYSVRGYPQSVSVGDNVYLFTAEYRFHLPQSLGVDPEPGVDPIIQGKPFRWQPQYPYGRADWDLVLRGFVDVGYTENSKRLSFERDDTLVGVGVGADLFYRQNFNVRVDWGFALESIPGRVESGDSEVHFVASILY